MHEALLYDKLDKQRVRCNLCAHHCNIAVGHRGFCQVRYNENGTLYTTAYGRTISRNIDPIEKKPLYHFYPGSKSFSIATPGCNMRCEWCQNWNISQPSCDAELNAGVAMSAAGDCRRGQSDRLPVDRLYLYRADDLFRIRP